MTWAIFSDTHSRVSRRMDILTVRFWRSITLAVRPGFTLPTRLVRRASGPHVAFADEWS